jgi:hypothetical protein
MMLRHPDCGTGRRTGQLHFLSLPVGRCDRQRVPIGEEIMSRENLSGAVGLFAIIAVLTLALLLWVLLSAGR